MMGAAAMSSTGPSTGYWDRWEERSHDWRASIDFMHPFGRDHAEQLAPLTAVLDALRAIPGVDVPPIEWLHATWLHLGFLRAEDIMWSQVETYYVSAAPRLRRVQPRPVRLGGIALTEDGRVTLGVEDAGLFRDARKQASIGTMKAREAILADAAMTPDGDTFAATIDIAFLDAQASAGTVAQAIEPYRALHVAEVTPTHLMLARVAPEPTKHFDSLDIVAEIPMLGDQHRGGYHN